MKITEIVVCYRGS